MKPSRYFIKHYSEPGGKILTIWFPHDYVNHKLKPNYIRLALNIPSEYIVYFPLRTYVETGAMHYTLYSHDNRWLPGMEYIE